MGNSADVVVGATGVCYFGDATAATLPTDAIASLDTDFKDLGFIDENGVTETIGQNTNDIKAWGGSTVRRVQTDHTVTLKFVMMETNPNSLAAYYKSANVNTGSAGPGNASIQVTSSMNQRGKWVVEVLDGSAIIRVVVPDGEVTGHDDVVYKTDSAVAYGIEITCYEDGSGVKLYKYLDVAGIS